MKKLFTQGKGRLLIALCIVMFALMTTGCKSSKPTLPAVPQASLLIECEESLPYFYGKEGSEWLRMAREWSAEYHQCANRQRALVEYIRSIYPDLTF